MTLELVLDPQLGADSAGVPQTARLHHFFERQCDATPHALAAICGWERLTYAALDARANRVANYLIAEGIRPGDRVGIRLRRSAFAYAAMLGLLKAGAAFVPIDLSYPADRVDFITTDAALALLIDTEIEAASKMSAVRPEVAVDDDSLAYIIYTSGSTGQPKGVPIDHSNICFFLNACTPVYRIASDDRVYQGMTLAFDFSIEEIWPTWIAGAVLVAGPNDSRRIGSGLSQFLSEHEITVLYCVPGLLATLDAQIPSLRMVVVGGESCPRDLVDRWAPRVRRMLNTYGPTETTVTATWAELAPGKPVTIGRPIPGYRVDIRNDEICIGGPGVARGYLNRPALTQAKFEPGARGPHARWYRTGDRGRFTADGEIEFLGRIDDQIKLRGFRLEPGEIESVLLEDPAVANAAVIAAGSPPSDLAAYVTLRNGASQQGLRTRLATAMQARLPAYMVPAYLEILDAMPVLASGKTDRSRLPAPAAPRLTSCTGPHVEPATPMEATIASVWRSIFGLEAVSVDSDFFRELGGHSLTAARAISQLRNAPGLAHASIADVYAHPTIRALARHLSTGATQARSEPERLNHSSARVRTAGIVQAILCYLLLTAMMTPGVWVLASHRHLLAGFSIGDLAVPVLVLLISMLLPIALKWTLIGRFRPGVHHLWSWYYCRLWLVRKAIELSPIHLLAGSPLIAVYARLLGARIGRRCRINTAHLHLPDLIEMGDGASIGCDVELQPFVVAGGRIHLAPIRIGAGAFIGTKSVILAGGVVGDRALVGEQSLVDRDRKIPAGESWQGSPIAPCAADPAVKRMDSLPPAPDGDSAAVWMAYVLGFVCLEALRLAVAVPGLALLSLAYRGYGFGGAIAATPLAGLLFVLTVCVVVLAGKRIVLRQARPGVYPAHSLFAARKWFVDRLMQISLSLTNTLYATLYAVPWLRCLGARIGPRSEISTVSHIDPDLVQLGSETFVADLASIGSAVCHHGYLTLGTVTADDRTFIGNASVIRQDVHLPANCLVGVASTAPARDPREGTSWLGSPPMFLPKREIYEQFSESVTYRPTPQLVAYRLLIEFFRIVLPPSLFYALGLAMTVAAISSLSHFGLIATAILLPAVYLGSAFGVTLLIASLKWSIVGRYRPRVEPLWAPFVRHTELITGLYESCAVPLLIAFATGTPFAAPLLRLFGADIGPRVWLDTTFITEFDLVHTGNDCAIGNAVSLQTHLFEDRVMKMATVSIGAQCDVGPRSVLLYDSTMHQGSSLDGLSLLMKGESLPPSTRWRGIPARLAT